MDKFTKKFNWLFQENSNWFSRHLMKVSVREYIEINDYGL